MRKLSVLFLVAALSLVSANVTAQEVKESVNAVAQKVQQDMEEVKLSDLPDAVKNTLAEKYAKHTPKKALKTKKDNVVIYYIKLQQGEEFETVMIDAQGIVIEPGENNEK